MARARKRTAAATLSSTRRSCSTSRLIQRLAKRTCWISSARMPSRISAISGSAPRSAAASPPTTSMAPASKVRFCVASRPARSSSAQVTFHSKAEIGNSPLRPPIARSLRCSTCTWRDSSQHWRASSRRSSQGASGKSARHCAAISRLVTSLLMWRCTSSRRATGPLPSMSSISPSRRTTRKQPSRAGSSRRRRPSSSKYPIALMRWHLQEPAAPRRARAASRTMAARRAGRARPAAGAPRVAVAPGPGESAPRSRARERRGSCPPRPRSPGSAAPRPGSSASYRTASRSEVASSRARSSMSAAYGGAGRSECWSGRRSSNARLPSASACCAKSQMCRPSSTFTSSSGVVGVQAAAISIRRASTKRKVAMRRPRSATLRPIAHAPVRCDGPHRPERRPSCGRRAPRTASAPSRTRAACRAR